MDEEEKKILKEAMREWLDEQKQKTYASIGEWFMTMLVVALVGFAAYLIMWVENHRT